MCVYCPAQRMVGPPDPEDRRTERLHFVLPKTKEKKPSLESKTKIATEHNFLIYRPREHRGVNGGYAWDVSEQLPQTKN